MSNPLFNQLGGGQQGNNNLLARFRQFKSQFSGDPQQKVQELLNSGKMSQAQFNQLSQMAQQFRGFLK